MKHTKTIPVPATTSTYLTHHTCDICNERCEPLSCYDVDEVTIKNRVGESYPEGGRDETTEFDICGECFRTKVSPWLQSQTNTAPRVEESDW